MYQTNWTRLTLDIVLFVSIFFLPWWTSVCLGVLGVFVFKLFWEVFVAALIIDAVYSPTVSLMGSRFALGALVLIVVAEIVIKRFTRFYDAH